MLKTELDSELLTIEQAKAYLKCSHVFLWKRRKEGKLKFVTNGRKVLIPKASLDEFIGREPALAKSAEYPIFNTATNPATVTVTVEYFQLLINNVLTAVHSSYLTREFKLLTETEAKNLLQCDYETLSALRDSKVIVSAGSGHAALYSKKSIDKYLSEKKEVQYEL